MAVTATKMALIVGALGVISFIFGIYAETKKVLFLSLVLFETDILHLRLFMFMCASVQFVNMFNKLHYAYCLFFFFLIKRTSLVIKRLHIHFFWFSLCWALIASRWHPNSRERCCHLQVPVESHSCVGLSLICVSYCNYRGWLFVTLLPLQRKIGSKFHSVSKHQLHNLL